LKYLLFEICEINTKSQESEGKKSARVKKTEGDSGENPTVIGIIEKKINLKK